MDLSYNKNKEKENGSKEESKNDLPIEKNKNEEKEGDINPFEHIEIKQSKDML